MKGDCKLGEQMFGVYIYAQGDPMTDGKPQNALLSLEGVKCGNGVSINWQKIGTIL
jgi:hypothetical protein